jgi:RNA polymerase sigma factor (sigma-70 family)
MAASSLHPLLHYLRRLSRGRAGDAALDDTQLLDRFLTSRDESAFTTLVQRYGAMIWGLCVRCLGETPEAEDAFQATFLVLVRKAASLRGPKRLGPWLYGVAYRTSLKLRGQRARRAARETPLPTELFQERPESIWSDLGPVLDEEITRLPTKYRLPVLLCCLQGLSSDEAAQRLGCAKGTVFSRLSRARDLLRRRLARRGVEVSAGALAAVLAENTLLRAAPSLALREMTIRTSLLLAAGTTGQTLSAPLAGLVEGVVRSMFLSKVKFALIIVLVVGIAGAGTSFLAHSTSASPPSAPSPPPVKQDDARAEAPAPAIAKAEAPAQPNPNLLAQNNAGPSLRDRLGKEIDYHGLEDARATLGDALDQLSKRYNLNIDMNEKAFEMDQPKDVERGWRAKIADPTPMPPMHATLSIVLSKILGRVRGGSGATYLLRGNRIEITTEAAVRAELGIPQNRLLLPLVSDILRGITIDGALRRLAHQSGYNIMADPEVADQLEKPITFVELKNVPVDTAVRLLANMARTSVVRLDNVLYVTTADNAKHLREEQAQVNADKAVGTTEPSKKPATDKHSK